MNETSINQFVSDLVDWLMDLFMHSFIHSLIHSFMTPARGPGEWRRVTTTQNPGFHAISRWARVPKAGTAASGDEEKSRISSYWQLSSGTHGSQRRTKTTENLGYQAIGTWVEVPTDFNS